jgi:TPR repeat protein
MTRRALVPVMLIMAAAVPVVLADSPQKDFDVVLRSEYYDLHRDAAAAYEKKKYEDAFKNFQRLACAGDKPSQAAMGEMYLMGKGVQRNDLVAYEWFKLAAEYNFAAYRKVSKTIEDQLTPAQAQVTGQRVTELLSLYGMRATNMSCEIGSSTWSASNMKDTVQCTPESVNAGTQFLLHRCVDEKQAAR